MTVDLYYNPASHPSRAVVLGAKAIGVTLNLKEVNLLGGEHLKPEFLKMNPQHAVPTLNDGGFTLSESRAILKYLADKYAKDDSLFPKDPKKRAIVNARLDFDIGTLYSSVLDYYLLRVFGSVPDAAKLKKMEDAFGILDKFLVNQPWVAGSSLTIADISIVSYVCVVEMLGFPLDKFANVIKWYNKCKKTLPSYDELTRDGLAKYKQFFDNATKK